jgi:uncharacterized damage-inducible protein DinB
MSSGVIGPTNREFFVRRWNQEHPAFFDVLNALPADRLDYRPHPSSRSAGELVSLLVAIEESCISLCGSGRSFNAELRWHSAANAASLADMIAAYEKHHHALSSKLQSLDDNIWNQAAWLRRGQQEILLKDTVGGLMWIALFDAVHHRGQLSTYIRPMGGRVPSIYGPSGDASARESQSHS